MIAAQGHQYVAGVSSPAIVLNSTVASVVAKQGFTNVTVINRADVKSLPPIPSGSNDDWDIVVIATRSGSTADMAVPDRVRWVVDVTPVNAPPAKVPPPPVGRPARGAAPLPQAPPPQPDKSLPDTTPFYVAIGVGVLGGAAIGKMAIDHLFVEGLHDTERKSVVKYLSATVAVVAVWKLLGFDTKWLTPEGAVEAAWPK